MMRVLKGKSSVNWLDNPHAHATPMPYLPAEETQRRATPEHTVFATTRWSVILAAGQRNGPDTDLALEELCQTYWFPLYAYLRRQGRSPENAEDLTQSFFARFLSRNYLKGLDSEQGKFRNFLLVAFKHFLANEWDHATRQKRGGGVPTLSLDWESAEGRYTLNPVDNLSPDRLYDRAWAVTLLERVVNRLRDECAHDGRSTLFAELQPFLTAGKSAIPYAPAAAALGLSEGAVRVAVHRLCRRYRDLLRAEISETLSDPTQVEEELRSLLSAFSD
jgi:DNA-directed RNA polymerase specialized sigma24 family protein